MVNIQACVYSCNIIQHLYLNPVILFSISFQVEILLQFRANPIITNKVGKTPLDLAAEFGKLQVVEILLESNLCGALIAGPRPTMENPSPISAHTPLHLAAKNGHSDVVR